MARIKVKLRRYIVMVALFVTLLAAVTGGISMFSSVPENLGVSEGRLAACPDSPNCVCSQASDARHQIEPLRFTDDPQDAFERLAAVVERMPRSRIVTRKEEYMHVEFTSVILRFIDDVEFLLDADSQSIHVRSASRVGYSDLGANRARVLAIWRKFEDSEDTSEPVSAD